MEALCRLSYSSGGWMIATPGGDPRLWHHGCVARPLIFALLPVLLLSAACSSPREASPSPTPPIGRVTFAGSDARLAVEVADSETERRTGLSGRATLAADSGMVFVWEEPVDATFWMKNTLIPLSIAFIADDGRIVAIREMAPCQADPCPTYDAPGPFRFAVEAPAGWYDTNRVAVGDVATVDLP
jgi:uncharacterized membrane protein (UPF0127 family)